MPGDTKSPRSRRRRPAPRRSTTADDLATTQKIPTDLSEPTLTQKMPDWLERVAQSEAPDGTHTQIAPAPRPPEDGATVIGPPPRPDTDLGSDTDVEREALREISVAVFEATDAHRQRASTILSALGHRVVEQAEFSAVDPGPHGSSPGTDSGLGADAIIVGFPGGARTVASALALGVTRPILVAALSGEPRTMAKRASAAGCDLFVPRPHSRDSLAQAMAAADALGRARERVAMLESAEAVLSEKLQRLAGADAETGLHPFEFFQRLLVMELKRARRYRYPLAACLVSVDSWPPAAANDSARDELRVRAAQALTACIRDVDLPVELGGDRFLVFLPYTSQEGADRVGERITGAMNLALSGGGDVSVGIAAIEPGPGQPVSFARLIGAASAALRVAQGKA